MEDLLEKIADLVIMEIEEVDDIKYVDKEMGNMFIIFLKNGKHALLSLIETDLKD